MDQAAAAVVDPTPARSPSSAPLGLDADLLRRLSATFGPAVVILLVQLVLEHRSDAFLADIRAFCGRLGLPLRLRDMDASIDAADAAETIATRSYAEAPYIRNIETPVDAGTIAAAITRLEAM